ncbi:ABC transporter ATP-binding protein [Halomonas daqiaonensis]|uniref:Amino acid/amide ABC transporter ATP-binding protein 1, HAAT family n=1 Tax=Halomonas daqiaonensis TaxID=650850 RepID=A0A1H7RY80_9GAMM|nr:ABC transporter ATP-binding protein [Halomonas daqiaonensis]SEL65192.1 amino acid/amide ABC transporter ATP-binding protein 1, HAAT family [Halomonas daqiaonensis]
MTETQPSMSSAPALEVAGLAKSFGSLMVASDVHLNVAPGERRGLIGINGAGKTTLFNMIAGELKPDRGAIRFFGDEITADSVIQRTLKGLGRTYQVSTLVPSVTVRENLALTRGDGRLPSLWQPWQSRLDDDLLDTADQLGLTPVLDEAVANLSYGTLRQLELAMVMACKPRLLLLDEPAAGLSHAERQVLQGILQDLPQEVTLLMIEHDMEMVLALSDRISVLHQGEMFAEGSPDEIAAHEGVRDIYLGRANG